MATLLQPKPFAVTEHAFTVSGEFDTETLFYIEYSNESSFATTYGGPDYGFRAIADRPYTLLVPVDPDCGSAGDVIHYRLQIWNGSSFAAETTTHQVRLRRPRSHDTGWSFVVAPDAHAAAGTDVSDECKELCIPVTAGLNADLLVCPGNIINDPPCSSLTWGRTHWQGIRESLDPISIPIYHSPGIRELETCEHNRRARLELFPCANMRARGHQVIRAPQEDWQDLDSDTTAVDLTTEPSLGSYYAYAYGNALFIHINDFLNSVSDPDFMAYEYRHQRNWLEAVLQEHRHKYKWCFMFGSTPIDESAPGHTNTLADDLGSQQFLMGLHEDYKVDVYFHGHYHGWRCNKVTHASGGSTWYVCSTFGAALDATSGDWTAEMAIAHVHIGMDANRTLNADNVKIDIVGVGHSSGGEANEVLNTTSTNNGEVDYADGTVVDHTSELRNITNVSKSSNVIQLGSEWVYNDNSEPDLSNDVDFVTGSTKFYEETYNPQMFSVNDDSGDTDDLWKRSTAPFQSVSAPTDDWRSYYDADSVIGGGYTALQYGLPSWTTPTTLSSTGGFLNNPTYFIRRFDIPEDIEPTELQLIYLINDCAFIWINGELAWYSQGEGVPLDVVGQSDETPFTQTNRPYVKLSWVDDTSGTTLDEMEPFARDSDYVSGDLPENGHPSGPNYNDSRTRLPHINYEGPDQPIKIDNPSIINKLKSRNNVVAVMLLQGREDAGESDQPTGSPRHGTKGYFDLGVTVLGTAKTNLLAPHLTRPSNREAFNRGSVNIVWNINDPADAAGAINSNSVTYEIEYTDNYQGVDTNWHTVKRRIAYSDTSYTWNVGKMIKSSKVRIRMRARSTQDESVSSWTISDEFSVNVFELTAPAIVSPMPKILYSDFILIVLDESLTRHTYNQKVRYTLEYSSRKRNIDWTSIVTDIPVGQNVIRWNLDGLSTSDDYILRLTAKNASTSCVDETTSPDQIARRFVHDVNIQQSGMFLIDTKPPSAVLEVESEFGVTNELKQIINIFAEDATTDVDNIRLRECDAGSALALGDLEDPYDPLGGCTALEEVVGDLDKFGKPLPLNPKTQWVFDAFKEDGVTANSGLKKIEALLTDVGGNTSLQEQVKVFLNIFSSTDTINDFTIVIEQRENITIDDDANPPVVRSDASTFEVVYLVTSAGDLWILEPFARLVWSLATGIEPRLVVEFNDTVYVLTYNSASDVGQMYTNNVTEATLLNTFPDAGVAGRNMPTAVGIYNNALYIGFESGALWKYDGLAFSSLTPPVSAPISSLFGDRRYLYIGFENSENIALYNGTSFFTLNLEV